MSATSQYPTLSRLAELTDPSTKARFAAQASEGVVNPIVLAKLVGVRPQMLYQYIAKGRLPIVEGVEAGVGTNSTQKKVIRLAVAEAWVNGYLGRKADRAIRAAAELEAAE